jgi:hypothetical protein
VAFISLHPTINMEDYQTFQTVQTRSGAASATGSVTIAGRTLEVHTRLRGGDGLWLQVLINGVDDHRWLVTDKHHSTWTPEDFSKLDEFCDVQRRFVFDKRYRFNYPNEF